MKKNYKNIKIILVIVLGIVLIVNVALLLSINNTIQKKTAEKKEAERSANIQIAAIKDLKCSDCSDPVDVVNFIGSKGFNVTKQEFIDASSERAKELISKYNIKSIPVVLIFGELDKVKSLDGFTKVDDALVQSTAVPPYEDLQTNEVRGLVSLTYINVSCDKCTSLAGLVEQLKSLKVKLVNEQYVDANTIAGNDLIKQYTITKLPAIILSKDINAYDAIKSAWKNVGSVEGDGSYVTRENNPPYWDIASKSVKGIVALTYLTDKSCTGCYNVSLHKLIVQKFSVYVGDERYVDVADSEGAYLIKKYKISLVPTIIMSGDAAGYQALDSAWKSVGTIEDDGSYVFRMADAMGTYANLTSGNITIVK